MALQFIQGHYSRSVPSLAPFPPERGEPMLSNSERNECAEFYGNLLIA